MGTPVPVNFGPDSGPARSSNVLAGSLVNCFVESAPNAKTPWAVYACPGLKEFSNTGNSSGCRGFLGVSESVLYAVFGETVYRFAAGGASTPVGTVVGTDYVRMAYNKAAPVEVAIVSEGKRYLMVSDVITEIADADLPQGAIDVAYLDGYFVFGYPDGLMYSSAINDGTSYSALDFTEAEAKPDRARALGVLGDRLVNFGANSVEFFYNDAAAEGFPFAPQGGALIDRGILDKSCWSDFDNSVAWIDDKGLVVRGEGTIAKTFGTYPVHKDIQDLIAKQETAKIAVSTWSFAGHDVFQIWSPEWCWCFDASSQMWFRRESQDRDTWAGRFVFRAFNKTLVADAQIGLLYEQREDTDDENGKARIIELTSNYVYSGASRIRHNSLVLDIETGVGNAEDVDGEGVTPECVVSWSDDGGKSFDGHRQVSIGRQGKYRERVKLNRLGTSGVHGRVYRVRFSAARPFTLIGALADVDVLRV
jgi:hypothetical protein